MIANALYFLVFRKEFAKLTESGISEQSQDVEKDSPVPAWITTVHLLFMARTVISKHYPELFIGGFLFFIGFTQATKPHQGKWELKNPILVGFFLAGLVTHGGLQ